MQKTQLVLLAVLAVVSIAVAQAPPRVTSRVPPIGSPPPYCKPCLFYGGDFDANNLNSGTVANEMSLLVSQAAVYVPFNVPAGKTWTVTGAFMIINSMTSVIDPAQAYWEIRSGVSSGNGGTLVASGTSPAAYKPTQGTNLYALLVKNISVPLTGGRYWVSVVPICTNPNDGACSQAQYFSVDVEDMPPPHHFGPLEPVDDSFLNSSFFNDNWVALNPFFCGAGCDRFSAGILGTSN
jgi:hypothetical protein